MKLQLRYLAIMALMAFAALYMAYHRVHPTPLPMPLAEFPSRIGDWRLIQNSQFDQETLDLLRPTDYLAKRYQRPDGAVVDIYIGYHDGARQAGQLHSPRNCLPGSGWYEASSERINVPMQDGNMSAVLALYQKDAVSELFLYWFEVGGASVSNEYNMKLRQVLNSIRQGRQDACFVRISVPVMDSKFSAVEQAMAFLKAVHPILKHSLPS
jgi:EpsI family protein